MPVLTEELIVALDKLQMAAAAVQAAFDNQGGGRAQALRRMTRAAGHAQNVLADWRNGYRVKTTTLTEEQVHSVADELAESWNLPGVVVDDAATFHARNDVRDWLLIYELVAKAANAQAVQS